MPRHTTTLALAILAAAGGNQACRKKPEPAPAPATTTPATDNGAAQRRADSLAALAAQRRADSLAAARAAANAANDEGAQAALRRVLTTVVYFDYDKDAIRDDARTLLDAKAAVLVANIQVTIAISGHTDEQGTSEYNLALGQRRAAQVKRYLEAKGVAENRMTTQSMGDSQPAVQGSDEAAYQQNRRAEFQVNNANGALARPKS
jgi:peptidoglycan-associated lipoprotein